MPVSYTHLDVYKRQYMNGKAPSLLSFGVKPSGSMSAREAGAKVLDAFKLFTRLVNIGDARSLATHSASTTHRQLSAEELKKAGVSEDTVSYTHLDVYKRQRLYRPMADGHRYIRKYLSRPYRLSIPVPLCEYG